MLVIEEVKDEKNTKGCIWEMKVAKEIGFSAVAFWVEDTVDS